ncbi:hypothetical protein BDR22DRAFT_885439 [Usnea florida]
MSGTPTAGTQQPPLPPLNVLVRPSHIVRLFTTQIPFSRHPDRRAAHFDHCSKLWNTILVEAVGSPGYQAAYRNLVTYTQTIRSTIQRQKEREKAAVEEARKRNEALQRQREREQFEKEAFERLVREVNGRFAIPSFADMEAGLSAFSNGGRNRSGQPMSEQDEELAGDDVETALGLLNVNTRVTNEEDVYAGLTLAKKNRHNIKLRERLGREVGARAPQKDTTADAENLLDEDLLPNDAGDKEDSQSDIRSDSSQEETGSTSDTKNSSDHDGTDSDARWESDKEQSNQHHDHGNNHDWRSGFTDHETPKPYNNPNQKRATGRDPSPPNDQNKWGKRKSSSLKGTPNLAQGPDSQGYGHAMGHRVVDGGGSKKRKISRTRSRGGS